MGEGDQQMKEQVIPAEGPRQPAGWGRAKRRPGRSGGEGGLSQGRPPGMGEVTSPVLGDDG